MTPCYQKTLVLMFVTLLANTLVGCAEEGREVWITPWSNFEVENRDVSRSEDTGGVPDTSRLDAAQETSSADLETDPDVENEVALVDLLIDNDAVFDGIADSDTVSDGIADSDTVSDGIADSDTVFDLHTDIHMPDASLDDADAECPLDRSGITYQMSRLDPAGVPQRIIIESVNFENDSIVIRNVSDEDVLFERDPALDNSPWRIGAGNGGNRTALPEGFSISAGDRVRIYLASAGTNDSANIYLEWVHVAADLVPDVTEGSEVAVLSPYG